MMNKRIPMVWMGLFLCLVATTIPALANHTTFATGDILVSISDGTVQWRHPDGTVNATLQPTDLEGQAKGMAFGPDGSLYVAHWWTPDLTSGNSIAKYGKNGQYLGQFGGSYFCNPTSIVFDEDGVMYVGQADCDADVLRFNSDGALVTAFNVMTESRGSQWVDLADDKCTLFYTSSGRYIKRYNVCTGLQLPDFNSVALPEASIAEGLVILPDGGVLVAATDVIVRFNASGTALATYDLNGENCWHAVALDPDGTSFWATNFCTSVVYKLSLADGQVLMTFAGGIEGEHVKAITIVPHFNEGPPLPPSSSNEGRMTGGGSFFTGGMRVTHGFQLRCDVNDRRQNLQVNWDRGDKFHLTDVTSVSCSDAPGIDPENPLAPIDTLILTGVGRYNGKDGATIDLIFTDAGEPGTNDGAQVTIRDSNGQIVLQVAPATLQEGNHQAHSAKP